jgi:hypothetical protein
MKGLNFGHVTALPLYRNLVLRFRGKENLIKIVGAKESFDLWVAYPSKHKL